MDKLIKIANYYKENLEGKKFHLQAGKKGTLIDLDIIFGAEHFKHLTGLHKLTDIPATQAKSEILYQRILNGEIKMNSIAGSVHLSEMKDRLSIFEKLKDTLLSPNLMLKSSHGKFRGVMADFLLVKQDDKNNVHLFLKGDQEGITIPVTYFARKDNTYLRTDSGRWTVLSVEEIKKEAFKHKDQSKQAQTEKAEGVQSTSDIQDSVQTKSDDDKLDLVACTIAQCGQKIDADIAQAKITQKETVSQQQAEQSRQVQQVGQVRQVGKVKHKAKSDNGGAGKR